ncbi:MAG: tetratricopeptide repeat protein [Bacteroidetes bacterium]|nr:tetratricopeptide repeat protein [Bacteroidota bacterium]
MAKKANKTEDKIVAVEEALGKTEQFIESNQKPLSIIIGAIVILILGYFGYNKFIITPLEKGAQIEMYMAEVYFNQDSLNLALYGDGNYLGFLDIIDEFGSTKSGKLSNYYAGICYLNKGEFEEAINYLKEYSINDRVIAPMALGAIGDAYIELKDYEKGASYYMDAVDEDDNGFTTPTFLMKAGMAYELQQNYNDAISVYERIQNDYKFSYEASNIEKYIARAKGLAK